MIMRNDSQEVVANKDIVIIFSSNLVSCSGHDEK